MTNVSMKALKVVFFCNNEGGFLCNVAMCGSVASWLTLQLKPSIC